MRPPTGMHNMSRAIEVVYKGRATRFSPILIDRKRLHGFKRKIALDENGDECVSGLLTRDGNSLLLAGSTSETYLDANGDAINRSELVPVDATGKTLPVLPSTLDRTQTISEPVEPDEFLGCVVTKAYALEAESLDDTLHNTLRDGAVFRISFRPRASHTETPAFLLANNHGTFLIQAEPCCFEFVGLDQNLSDIEVEFGDEVDADEFSFEDGWEADHAIA